MQCYNGWFAESRYNHHVQWVWEQFMNYIVYAICFLSSQSWGCGIIYICFCLICLVHTSFTNVYLTTCMYAIRKFALCECYCLQKITLCRCVVALLMWVCFSVCCLFLFANVLWSFLCEYVCKYLLFISLCRCEMVLISLCRCEMVLLYVSMFCKYLFLYFSLQMCCGPYMWVCL